MRSAPSLLKYMEQLSLFYERARPRAGHLGRLEFPGILQGPMAWVFLQRLPRSARSSARLTNWLVPPADPAYFRQLSGGAEQAGMSP